MAKRFVARDGKLVLRDITALAASFVGSLVHAEQLVVLDDPGISTSGGRPRARTVHCTVSTLETTIVTSLLRWSYFDACHSLVMAVMALILGS